MRNIRLNLFESLNSNVFTYIDSVSDMKNSKNIEENIEKVIFKQTGNNTVLCMGDYRGNKERFSHAYIKCKEEFDMYLVHRGQLSVISSADAIDELINFVTGNNFNNESVINSQIVSDDNLIKYNDRLYATKITLSLWGFEGIVSREIESYENVPFYFADNSTGYIKEVSC